MFESWIENIRLYRRERFPLRVFAPVSMTLTVAAFAGARPLGVLEVLIALTTSAMLLFQFRLWDDLADRSYDGVHHPDRVLSRSHCVWLFNILVALSGGSNVILLLFLRRSPAAYILLCGAALFWYGVFSEMPRRSIVGRHLLLLKYAAFVWLIAPTNSRLPELLSSMAIVYLCVAIFELLHDREMRSQPAARAVMVIEVCALGCIAAAILGALGESL